METILRNDEYKAWKDVVKELRRLGIEINKEENLCERIEWWGCKIADLKIYQAKKSE